MKTLLQMATESVGGRKRRTTTNQEIDLAIALVNGEITFQQCADALKMKHKGNVSHFLTTLLRNGCIAGKIKVTKI